MSDPLFVRLVEAANSMLGFIHSRDDPMAWGSVENYLKKVWPQMLYVTCTHYQVDDQDLLLLAALLYHQRRGPDSAPEEPTHDQEA